MKRLMLAVLVIGVLLLGACNAPSAPQAEGTPPAPAPTPKSHIYTQGIIEVGGDGEPIELINNPDATNPTYAELVAFIKRDPIDEYSYILGPPKNAYVCSDFAEDVHNNAEAAGIRAAWIGIKIEGRAEGHALNAFQTTDRGLVFIDSTGKGLWDDPVKRTNWDRRAYVEVGQPYAVAYLDYYDHYHSKIQFFTHMVEGGGVLGKYLGNIGKEVQSLKPETLRTFYEAMGWVGEEDSRQRRHRSWEALKEWEAANDIGELRIKWVQEWIRQNEVKLYRWEIGEWSYLYQSREIVCNPIRMRADVVPGSWFKQPIRYGTIEEKVIVIDGMPIIWYVDWVEQGWNEPFKTRDGGEVVSRGVVNDVHIHWGE